MKAIILKKHQYSESDLVVEMLLESGQVAKAFARSAKRSKKRFPHQFNLSGLYQIEFGRRIRDGQLAPISSCELVRYVSRLDQDIDDLSRWCSVLEWIRLNDNESHSFDQLEELLLSFADPAERAHTYYLYFIQELVKHGIYPELSACVLCHKGEGRLDGFSISNGGVVHTRCLSEALPLSEATRLWWLQAMQGEESAFERSMAQELDYLLLAFLQYQMGRPLKSYDFFLKTSRPDSAQV